MTVEKHAFLPSYPAGVFVVLSKRDLAPLIARLRAERRLKAGRNVTVFDVQRFAELRELRVASGGATPTHEAEFSCANATGREECCAKPASHSGEQPTTSSNAARAPPILRQQICLFEWTPAEITASLGGAPPRDDAVFEAVQECCSLLTLTHSPDAVRLRSLLQIPLCQRSDSGSEAEAQPTYSAVHVAGWLSDADLQSYLSPAPRSDSAHQTADATDTQPSSSAGASNRCPAAAPPVAFVAGVRLYHHVCCPEVATELPSAVAALRRTALLQRYRTAEVLHEPSEFTFSELFGGIGMFRSAMERVGGRATVAVEFAPPAQIVYALNHTCWHDCPAGLQLPNAKPNEEELRKGCDAAHPPPLLVGDITEIPSSFFPHHDVLTGGFPCQSFAKAGAAAGLQAEKGWLFYEVVRVLAAAQPLAFLLENVEHLVEVDAGAQLEEILCRLRCPTAHCDEGGFGGAANTSHPANHRSAVEYEVRHVVIDGGVLTPQTRRRVYFFGSRRDQSIDHQASVTDSRQGRTPPSNARESAAEQLARVVAAALQHLQAASASSPYQCVQDLLLAPSTADLPVRCHRTDAASELQLTAAQWEAVQRSRTFRQNPLWRLCDIAGKARTLLGSYRTSYQLYSEFVPYSPALSLAEVKAALVACGGCRDGSSAEVIVSGAGLQESKTLLRFFSVRECARLQGIDDSFQFPHAAFYQVSSTLSPPRAPISATVERQVPPGAVYKLIGNAVNPRVVACLGEAIATHLRERRALVERGSTQ